MTQLRKAMLEELQRRNLSPITTRIYLRCVGEFARYFRKSPDQPRIPHGLVGHAPNSRFPKPIIGRQSEWRAENPVPEHS